MINVLNGLLKPTMVQERERDQGSLQASEFVLSVDSREMHFCTPPAPFSQKNLLVWIVSVFK